MADKPTDKPGESSQRSPEDGAPKSPSPKNGGQDPPQNGGDKTPFGLEEGVRTFGFIETPKGIDRAHLGFGSGPNAFQMTGANQYFAQPERGGPETLADLWTGNPSLWAYGAYYAADSASPPGEGAPGDGNAKWKQVDELGNVAAATLVLTGREDRVTGPEVSVRIAAGVRRSRLVVAEECGHMSWVERPGEVWGVVDEFLAQKV
ncbi:hypothetical protein G647_03053 [Cladophialophora carrionii CBS 160.54]|uniref:AB hydrolase-1 domain-containing protein n=1 Tax=Cladophialophora carrionii CBS 160.54 TaxID=1279043 RepID=V9DHW0_9EURO|nr:uncharacterized protein G647_03053 [Cladophialophora carrionii CBS 160.54]ETI26276.1 hypothetical protein G647_03053 [Cladophialophora carrionii CBS 160.54]